MIDILNLFSSQTLLQNEFNLQNIHFKKLAGDASHKCFYRVTTNSDTFILIKIPTTGAASQEIFSVPNQLAITPARNFIEIAMILAKHLPNIAAIYSSDLTQGLVLLADHGNDILEKKILATNPSHLTVHTYFEMIFSWVKQLQQLDKNSELIATKRQLCSEALFLELKEFYDYILCRDNTNDMSSSLDLMHHLATEISTLPQSLIHRDLHSKNIMVQDEKIWIIDFQDMCLGPYLYDLASVIFDPYLNLSLSQQLELAELYWAQQTTTLEKDKFMHDLTLIAMQRLLKCAGRFAYIYVVNGRDTHQRYIQPAINKAKELLQFHPEYGDLLAL